MLLLCLVGIASPAAAQVEVDSDQRQDVTLLVTDEQSGQVTSVPAQAKPRADITRFRTAHRFARVWMRTRVGEVQRTRDGQANAAVWVRGSDGHVWVVLIRYWKREYIDLTRLRRHRAPVEVHCPGLRAEALRKHNAYEVSLPRTCIGSPRWVRTGATVGFTRLADPHRTWIDRARVSVPVDPDSPPDLGPRLSRGKPSDGSSS